MTSGELIYVDVDEARGFTTAGVAAGATTLSLDSAALLPADLAQVSIDGEVYGVESLTVAVDEDLAGTLVLSEPLVADVELGQPVDAVPATDVTYGLVAVAGDSEPTRVLVPQADQDSMSLTLGPREYGQGEAVEFSTGLRGPELTWVEGRLSRDGSYIDPETLPPTDPWGIEPPADAPVLTVTPFAIGAVRASWPTTGDAQEFEVHVSLTSPVPEDGSAFDRTVSANTTTIADVAGQSLPMGETAAPVYVKVRPVNPNGPGPWSNEESATARQADNEFISALYAYFGPVEATQILSGIVTADLTYAGKSYIGPLDGRHIEIDPAEGITLFGANGTDEIIKLSITESLSVFRGQIETDRAAILDALELIGTGSKMLTGAGMTMEAGVTDPETEPTVIAGKRTSSWPAVPPGWTERGIDWYETGNVWYRMLWASGRVRVQEINAAGTSVTDIFTTTDGLDFVNGAYSIVRLGVSWYSVIREKFADNNYYWRIARWASNGNRVSTVLTYDPASTVLGNPTLGRAAGLSGPIVAARLASNNKISTVRVEADLSAFISGHSYYTIGGTAPLGLRSVAVNTFDGGANRLMLAHSSTVRFLPAPSWDNATATVGTALEDLTLDATSVNGGVAYRTGSTTGFYSTAGDGQLRRWSTYVPGTSGEKWWARYANTTDTDTTGWSPVGSQTMPARWWPSVQLPSSGSSTTSAGVWVGYGTTLPTTFYKRTEALAGRSMQLDDLRVTTGDTTEPTNTFGDGAPSWIKSALGGIEFRGDGYFRAPKAFQSGTATASFSGSAVAEPITVVFDTPYDEPPSVTGGCSAVAATAEPILVHATATTTSCTLQALTATKTALGASGSPVLRGIVWQAIVK